MSPTDPLVRWETAAIREAAERRGAAVADAPPPPASRSRDAWITLRAAHYETGLPIETLRKWARRKHIPSEIRETEFGARRVVDLVAVRERALRLGRDLRPVPDALREPEGGSIPGAPASPPAVVDLRDADAPSIEPAVVDLRDANAPSVEPAPAEPTPTETPGTTGEATHPDAETSTTATAGLELEPAEPSGTAATTLDEDRDPTRGAPPGTMIVPIAAWDRMLMQLGNLHQAGQQLADARERAAKAETEAAFLRERLTELRARTEPTDAVAEAGSADAASPTPEPADRLWRYVIRGWRNRRR